MKQKNVDNKWKYMYYKYIYIFMFICEKINIINAYILKHNWKVKFYAKEKKWN
jgi:hypothetical protein